MCRLFKSLNSNALLHFKIHPKRWLELPESCRKKNTGLCLFTKAICMKIIFIPFFSNSLYICYVTVITLLGVCKAKGGSQVKNNTGRLMTLCFANTMQKMLKDYDAHICLFYYCGLNVVSSVTSD